MRFWFPAVAGWIWIFGFTLVLVLVNASSVKLFGAVEYCFSAMKIFAIVVFLILGSWVVFVAPHAIAASGATSIGFSN